MSTDYTHFSQLAFDRLFARGADGVETIVVNSSGAFVGPVSISGALSVKSLNTASNATIVGTLLLSALGTGVAHVSSTGVISSSTIVNADVSGSAAIDGSKIVSASSAVSGVMSTGTQSFAGTKTFVTPLLGSNVANASTSASGVVTTGAQSLAGAKTLAGNFLPEATGTRNLGSTSLHWNQIWGDSLRMGGSQIGSTNERISAQNSLTATTSLDNRLSYIRATSTGNTSITTGVLKALVLNTQRTITASTTDSAGDNGPLEVQFIVATGGQTYTNTNTSVGNGAIIFDAVSQSGGGTLAISRYAHALFKTDSIATGTRKSYINFGALSGATNNAYISTGDAFSGSFFIYSSVTSPSVFSGYHEIASQGDPGTTADAIRIGSRDISAGNSTLALGTETAVVSESVTSDRTLQVYINGTVYKICLKA